MIHGHIAESKLNRETNSELLFTLPSNQFRAYPALFNSIDKSKQKGDLGIKGYGITLTTLEDVFLKINDHNDFNGVSHESSATEDVHFPNLNNIEFGPSFKNKLVYFSTIRFAIILRNWAFLFSVGVNFLVIMALFYVFTFIFVKVPKTIHLNPKVYPIREVLYTELVNDTGDILDAISKHLKPEEIPAFSVRSTKNNIYGLDLEHVPSMSIIFNKSYYHALPILQNVMANGFVSMALKKPFEIKISSDPLPDVNPKSTLIMGYLFILIAGMLLDTTPVFIAIEVVEERSVS